MVLVSVSHLLEEALCICEGSFLEWGLDDMPFCFACVNILEAMSCSSHIHALWASNLLGMCSLMIEHKQDRS